MSRRFFERHVLHHIARLHNLLKSLHNSAPISLASPCRLPHVIPAEDRCGSKVLWDPDGTFLTIRFGLPLENDPLPVCDTNVSSSARNERTPPNEILKKCIISQPQYFCLSFSFLSWFEWKDCVSFFYFLFWKDRKKYNCNCDKQDSLNGFQGKSWLFTPRVIYQNSHFLHTNKISRVEGCAASDYDFHLALIRLKAILPRLLYALLAGWHYWTFPLSFSRHLFFYRMTSHDDAALPKIPLHTASAAGRSQLQLRSAEPLRHFLILPSFQKAFIDHPLPPHNVFWTLRQRARKRFNLLTIATDLP